ncbi:MAG: DUF4192 domain-containing protein [Micromonosporaceae bacterium]
MSQNSSRDPSDLVPLQLRSPADVLVAVPYLIGFHPDHSLVLVGFDGPELVLTARADLPPVGRRSRGGRVELVPGPGEQLLATLTPDHHVDEVVLVAYGSSSVADPVMEAAVSVFDAANLVVRDALRVAEHRFWSYLCQGPECCPAEGTALDIASSPVAAAATVAGLVALPDRASLESQLEPATGAARRAMARATDRAERRLCAAFESGDLSTVRRQLIRQGKRLLNLAVRRHRRGDALGDDDIAWFSVLLLFPELADAAWRLMASRPDDAYVGMWADMVRRVEPELSAPPASLLAFAAWQAGDGALAGIAAQRALQVAPDYQPAQLMSAAVTTGRRPYRTDQPSSSTRSGQA